MRILFGTVAAIAGLAVTPVAVAQNDINVLHRQMANIMQGLRLPIYRGTERTLLVEKWGSYAISGDGCVSNVAVTQYEMGVTGAVSRADFSIDWRTVTNVFVSRSNASYVRVTAQTLPKGERGFYAAGQAGALHNVMQQLWQMCRGR